MFAKQIASKDRHAFFSNENIADDVKRKAAKKKLFVQNGAHSCEDLSNSS